MVSTRWLVLFLLCTCAAPISTRNRRVPRGWTLDSSKQDIRAVNIQEQKAFGEGKIIAADNYSSESLTTEASLSPNEGKASFGYLVDEYNKLKCKAMALEDALNDAQDWHCLAKRRVVEKLEVHVATSVGAMRSDKHWPLFSVNLGSPDPDKDEKVVGLGEVPAVDGGTIIFRKNFEIEEDDKTRGHSMEEVVRQITFKLDASEARYIELKNYFGREYCTERKWWGRCKEEKTTSQQSYLVPTNTISIDSVEIYLYFVDDERPYKVFASDTSMAEPLVYLDKIMPVYSIANFKNNPHWLMHYNSRSCETWGDAKHDGSKFGKYVWENYIAKKDATTPINYNNLECAGASHVPVYVEPEIPEIKINKNQGLTSEDIAAWQEKQADSFKPPANRSKPECQPRTAKIIVKEAEEQNQCGGEREDSKKLIVPSDIDSWTAERLTQRVSDMQKENGNLVASIAGLTTDLNKITGSGHFYETELINGVQVKITGQQLVNVGGQLMTRERASKCIFSGNSDLGEPRDNPVYINLGLNAPSYPIIPQFSGDERQGKFPIVLPDPKQLPLIPDVYTENFALRDIRFLQLSKKADNSFFATRAVATTRVDNLFGSDTMTHKETSIDVEYGIVAIHSIELIFDAKIIYELGTAYNDQKWTAVLPKTNKCDENSDVLSPLFVLTSRNSAWTDYGLRSNPAWVKFRDEIDHGAEEDTEEDTEEEE